MMQISTQQFSYKIPGYYMLLFNIDRALELANSGQSVAVVEIPREEMQAIAASGGWRAERVAAVDYRIPGIFAPVYIPKIDKIIFILIDGTHRCVAALQANQPFSARVLSASAAEEIMLLSDRRLMPWLSDNEEFAKLEAVYRAKLEP
jgi:hypothetical protein